MNKIVRSTGTLVRPTGIEPALREELDPKSSASANSATGAKKGRKELLHFVCECKVTTFS